MKSESSSRKQGAPAPGGVLVRSPSGSQAGGFEAHPWPRQVRLLRRGEFQRVYSMGSRHSNPLFAAFVLKTDAPISRIGLTAPRALGKANARNRIKRWLREAARLHLPELGPGFEIVFNPRRAVFDADFTRVETEVTRLFRQVARRAGEAGQSGQNQR